VLVKVLNEIEGRVGLFGDDLLLGEADLLPFFGQIFAHPVTNRCFSLLFVFLGFFELLLIELRLIHLTQLPLHMPHNTRSSDLRLHLRLIIKLTVIQLRFPLLHRAILLKRIDGLFLHCYLVAPEQFERSYLPVVLVSFPDDFVLLLLIDR